MLAQETKQGEVVELMEENNKEAAPGLRVVGTVAAAAVVAGSLRHVAGHLPKKVNGVTPAGKKEALQNAVKVAKTSSNTPYVLPALALGLILSGVAFTAAHNAENGI